MLKFTNSCPPNPFIKTCQNLYHYPPIPFLLNKTFNINKTARPIPFFSSKYVKIPPHLLLLMLWTNPALHRVPRTAVLQEGSPLLPLPPPLPWDDRRPSWRRRWEARSWQQRQPRPSARTHWLRTHLQLKKK